MAATPRRLVPRARDDRRRGKKNNESYGAHLDETSPGGEFQISSLMGWSSGNRQGRFNDADFVFVFVLFVFFLVWTVAAEVSSVLVKLMIVTHATTPEGCVLSVTPATVHGV